MHPCYLGLLLFAHLLARDGRLGSDSVVGQFLCDDVSPINFRIEVDRFKVAFANALTHAELPSRTLQFSLDSVLKL